MASRSTALRKALNEAIVSWWISALVNGGVLSREEEAEIGVFPGVSKRGPVGEISR